MGNTSMYLGLCYWLLDEKVQHSSVSTNSSGIFLSFQQLNVQLFVVYLLLGSHSLEMTAYEG